MSSIKNKQIMRINHLLFIFFLFAYKAYSSVNVSSVRLDVSDGLSNNTVRSMFQDSKGFIWFGTLNGLTRYDGISFKTYTQSQNETLSLPDHRVSDVFEDNNGFLWVKTGADLYGCYNLKTEEFVDFTGCGEYNDYYINHYFSETEENVIWLWGDRDGCRRIFYKDGKFSSVSFLNLERNNIIINDLRNGGDELTWIATSKGLYYWDGIKINTVNNNKAFQLIQNYKSKTFFITVKGEIYQFDNQKKELSLVSDIRMERKSKITGAFSVGNKWNIFYSEGSISFDMNIHELVPIDTSLNISKAQVLEDNKHNFWIYNNTGILRYVDVKSGKVKEFNVTQNVDVDYIDEERFDVVHDSRDILWIATYGNGLFTYDINNDVFSQIEAKNGNSPYIFGSNYLLDIMEDKIGNIWVSSEFTGVSKLYMINKGAFMVYPNASERINRSNTVRCLSYIDDELYVFTRTGTCSVYDKDLNLKSSSVLDTNIYALLEDSEGNKWYGSRGKGLIIDNVIYRSVWNDSLSLSSNHVYSMLMDSDKRVWIATLGGGLNLAIKKEGKYIFKHFFNKTYGQKRVRTISQDSKGWMWIGTDEGLFVFNPDELIKNPDSYYHYSFNNGLFKSNEIRCIESDSKGNIWISEAGAGFAYCNVQENDYSRLKFEHFGTEDGLINNMVQKFVEDSFGRMWISTEYGISCFSLEKKEFKNFFFSNIDLGNTFCENCGIVLDNGNLIFGTNYGFMVIDPEQVKLVENDIFVTFTDLKVNGVSVKPNEKDSPIVSSLPFVNEVELNYSQNSFVVEFSTMDFDMGNSKYSYILKDYDNEWHSPSNINFAAYKNLPYGTYYLHVKACNASGKWGSEDSVLKIVVNPPFWRTSLAYFIYFVLLSVLLYIIIMVFNKMNNLRNQIKIEEQMTEFKLVFFTNISHEFRTPLSLIQGALEKLNSMPNIPKDMVYSIKLMNRSTKRMMRLVNQLIEFRKMQKNKLSLSLEETDIVFFINNIYLDFKDAAESKNMDFVFRSSENSYLMYFDKSKVDKIVYNLLSNAFKYTPSGGNIELSLFVNNGNSTFDIKVSDTGVGISKEERKELFKRFTHNRISGNSMGIGLNLTYELVTVHKGSIRFDDNVNGGSIFTISLPLGTDVYESEDFLKSESPVFKEEKEHSNHAIVNDIDESFEERIVTPLNKKRILIVEDDNDVRSYLKETLSKYFEVIAEADGKSGLEYVRSSEVDLIISDVMMPGMSGFELTKSLKNDFTTSHIPIVLLTALETSESYLEGIEVGADSYITKPFSTKLLVARVFKLISQREKLREKFSKDPTAIHDALCTTDKDKEFADSLSKIVDEHLSNENLSVDELASLLGVGRSIFYRKVKGITGYSPNEYIRIKRMRKATTLLLEGKMNISEISYSVGIADPFYFSKCFKSQFGVSPSTYQKLKGKLPDSDKTED